MQSIVSSLEWYVINAAIKINVSDLITSFVNTNDKNFRNLTCNKTLPITHEEVVRNLSSSKLSPDELD